MAGKHRRRPPRSGLSSTVRLPFLAAVALAVVGSGGGLWRTAAVASGESTVPSLANRLLTPVPVRLRPRPERSAPPGPAVAPPVSSPSPWPAVPERSGAGRRIVYCNSCQRVWLVESDGSVVRSYQVSGRRGVPRVGTYGVKSKSHPGGTANGLRLDHMVRFTKGRDLWIGFHAIPVGARGPIQSERQLGRPLSHGCVRQAPADARALWAFAPVGTAVVVVA